MKMITCALVLIWNVASAVDIQLLILLWGFSTGTARPGWAVHDMDLVWSGAGPNQEVLSYIFHLNFSRNKQQRHTYWNRGAGRSSIDVTHGYACFVYLPRLLLRLPDHRWNTIHTITLRRISTVMAALAALSAAALCGGRRAVFNAEWIKIQSQP